MSKNLVKVSPGSATLLVMIFLSLPACDSQKPERKAHKITATNPQVRAVTVTKRYSCQIESHHHINIRSFTKGTLESIAVKRGQAVKHGDLMFRVIPSHEQAKREIALAEARLAQLESKRRQQDRTVSQNEVAPADAASDQPNVTLTTADMNLTDINAPFDGVVEHLKLPKGTPVLRGDVLATLSDNSLMWAYFNVPEAGYLDYMNEVKLHPDGVQVELLLWNGEKFDQPGTMNTIEAGFNHETGSILFRADFPNPDGRLHHGQRGTVLISRVLNDAIVVPERATFEVLNKRYVFVIDKENVAHQREIVILNEADEHYVVKSGLSLTDRIVLEGAGHIRDGDKVKFENLAQKTD